MYKTILVPLDGSELSEQALPLAKSMARGMNAKLLLLQAVHPLGLPSGPLNNHQIRAINEAEAYLARIAADLLTDGIIADTAVMDASPAHAILDEIKLRDIDMVVMTTHGRSGLGRWVYGSVAEAVLHGSPVPVLLVRCSTWLPEDVVEQTYPRFLVPLDGSEVAEAAVPHAIYIARKMNATVYLIHVHEPPELSKEDVVAHPEKAQDILERDRQVVERYLSVVANQFKEAGINTHILVRSGAVTQTILEESWDLGVSLIIMASHGRAGLSRMFFGSKAMEILHFGMLPVLLVRPGVPVTFEENEQELVHA
ncbi:MAG: universal stress protein [Anaerolineae bacterium]